MAVVHVREPFAYQLGPVQMVITPDRFFLDNDPIVKANPRAGWEPVEASAPMAVFASTVESATAFPGEKRDVRRPR